MAAILEAPLCPISTTIMNLSAVADSSTNAKRWNTKKMVEKVRNGESCLKIVEDGEKRLKTVKKVKNNNNKI